MMSALRGFTIVEVLIALAISGALLAASIAVFAGRRGDTEFSQAVYDLQSKIQNVASQVSSKAIPGYQQYTCSVSATSRPVLADAASADETTGQDCIYIGQAIQTVDSSGDTLYNYPVFGLKTIQGSDPVAYPQDVASARPEPAIKADGSFVLKDTYQLLGGLKTLWARTGGTDTNLIGLYSNLFETNTSGNEIAAMTYSVKFNSTDDLQAGAKNCIEGGCSPAGIGSKTWQLCVSNGDRSAVFSLFGTATGVNTNVQIKETADCS